MFENNTNFSGIQYQFLHWLKLYDLLYTELVEDEWHNLDDAVINTDWRCDCFLYWRSKELEKKMKKYKADERKNSPKKGLPIWKGKEK